MEKFVKKFLIYAGIFIAVIIVIELALVAYVKLNRGSQKFNLTCVSETTDETVRGQSLTGIIADGETVKLQKGFYNCNPVQRGDIVAFNLSGRPEPIIKIVKALPGDSFALEKNNGGKYNIIINGQIAMALPGQSYELTEGRQKMLELYINDYDGAIPPDTYLLLGTVAGGSLDSTRFGLVGKEGIIGKVEVRSKK